ncbi:MAG: putative membrane protein [Lysobacterales bacterium]|jgi:putative membrane protein
MTNSSPALTWKRTSPIAVVFFLFSAARQFLNVGLPAIAFILTAYVSAGDLSRALIQTGLIVAVVVGVGGSVLSWLRFRYCIAADRVLVRSGVFHREELSVDFGRIQNVSIREPFYARPFGLALLSIDTAGSGKKEIVLGGIDKDDAVILRQIILSKTRSTDDHIESQHEPEADPTLLLSRSAKDIAIYGLTINYFFWLMIAMGAVWGAYDSSEGVFLWLARTIHLEEFFSFAQGDGNLLESALMVLATILAGMILLPLISVIGALFRHYGYQLSVEDETYRKNSGLLSRHDESLKRHKIQAVVLKQNFVAKRFKRSNIQLKVASAGSGLEQGQLPALKSSFLVPALHPAEVTELVKEFLPGCQVDEAVWSRVNLRRFATVTLGLRILPITLIPTASLMTVLNWKFMVVPFLATGIGWFVVHQYWKKLAYAVVGEYGFFRNGFIGTKTTIFPLFKVQNIELRQTPGQRRKGLAHLTIHLASHSLHIPYMKVEDAKKMQDLMLFHVESTNRPWY